MKWIFIVNKVAGNGKYKKVVKNVEKYCVNKDVDFEVFYTRCPGEATAITLRYKKSKNIIFAVGGDGTLNEVLNGIVHTKNILAVVPTGSGNDFYKTLKMIPDGILKCDVGKVNELYFLNTVCLGIDADVANNIDIMKIKGISTNKLYIASLMNTFLKYNCKKMTFNLNNTEVSGEFTTLAVCNGKFYGNGFKIAPKAKIDDGFFDFYFVDKMSKLKMFNLIMKLKSGTHDFSPLVHKRLVSQLKVKSKKNIISNVDGEKYINKEFNFKICKKLIHVYNNKKLIEEFIK